MHTEKTREIRNAIRGCTHGLLELDAGVLLCCHARHEPGHGHRRSGSIGSGDELRRQHHELHLQCGVASNGGEQYVVHSGADSAAYGINSIPNFGSATADGSGQTIAIVDAGNDPSIITDLDGFDQAMSLTTNSSETLYQQYGPASSILTVYNQSGTNITAHIATAARTACRRTGGRGTGRKRWTSNGHMPLRPGPRSI